MKYRTIIVTKSQDEVVGAAEEADDLRHVADELIAPLIQRSKVLTIDVDRGAALVPVDHISVVYVVEDMPSAAEDGAPAAEEVKTNG